MHHLHEKQGSPLTTRNMRRHLILCGRRQDAFTSFAGRPRRLCSSSRSLPDPDTHVGIYASATHVRLGRRMQVGAAGRDGR